MNLSIGIYVCFDEIWELGVGSWDDGMMGSLGVY